MLASAQRFSGLVVRRGSVGSVPWKESPRSVVVCIDTGFEFFCRVTLISLLLNTPWRDYKLSVLVNGCSAHLEEYLDEMGRKFGVTIDFFDVEYGVLTQLRTRLYWSAATYLRWLAPLVIQSPVLLYLDSDLVVQADVHGLFDLFDPAKTVGGVQDLKGAEIRKSALGLTPEEPYLNTGVLLINAERWRLTEVTERAVSFGLAHPEQLLGVDQDAINHVLVGEKYVVPSSWNVQTYTTGYYGLKRMFGARTFEGIFHFSGEVKPWMRWADPWGQELYLKYASLLGLPCDFWVEPRTIKEKLRMARAADERNNFNLANTIRREIIPILIQRLGSSGLENE